MSRAKNGIQLVNDGVLSLKSFNHVMMIEKMDFVMQPVNIAECIAIPLDTSNIRIFGFCTKIERWQYFEGKDLSLQQFYISDNTGTIKIFVWGLPMPLDFEIGAIIKIQKGYKRGESELTVRLEDLKKREAENHFS